MHGMISLNGIARDRNVYLIPDFTYPFETRMIMFEDREYERYQWFDTYLKKKIMLNDFDMPMAKCWFDIYPNIQDELIDSFLEITDNDSKWIKIAENKPYDRIKEHRHTNNISNFKRFVSRNYEAAEQLKNKLLEFTEPIKMLKEYVNLNTIGYKYKEFLELDRFLTEMKDNNDNISKYTLIEDEDVDKLKVAITNNKVSDSIFFYKNSTLNQNLDNLEEFKKEFRIELKEITSPESIQEFKKFLNMGERWGWD